MINKSNTKRWLTRGLLGASLATSALLSAGCDDEFKTGATVERMRLLAAKTIVDGDAERAWLRPGDSGRLAFTVAFPEQPADDMRPDPLRDVRSMFLVCTKGDLGTGQPQCQELLDAVAATQDPACQSSDAGVPDAGAPDAGGTGEDEIQKQVRLTLERLNGAGIGCDDTGDIGDPTDPMDDVPDYLGNAQTAIRSIFSTTQAAKLECGTRAPSVAFQLAREYHALTGPVCDRVPSSAQPDRLVQGVICEYGEPVFTSRPPFFGCRYEVGSDPSLPEREPLAEVFFFTVGVEKDGKTNVHPQFGATPLEIAEAAGGVPIYSAWPDGELDEECMGVTGISRRNYGDKSKIRINAEAMRELISANPDKREVYQVEAYSTLGELDRQFSVIDDLDVEPMAEIEWDHGKAPEGNSVGAQRVEFTFLIRDGRGGLAVTTRQLCLVP